MKPSMGKILPGESVTITIRSCKDAALKCKFQLQVVQVMPGEYADSLADQLLKLPVSRFLEIFLKATVEVSIFRT